MDIKKIIALCVISGSLQTQGAAPVAAAVPAVGKQLTAECIAKGYSAARILASKDYSTVTGRNEMEAIAKTTLLIDPIVALILQYTAPSPWLLKSLKSVATLSVGRPIAPVVRIPGPCSSADGLLDVCCRSTEIAIVNQANGKWFGYGEKSSGPRFTDLAWAPCVNVLAGITDDRILRLFNENTMIGEYAIPFQTDVGRRMCLEWSPDGKRLATYTPYETVIWEPSGDLLSGCQQEMREIKEKIESDYWNQWMQENAEEAKAAAASTTVGTLAASAAATSTTAASSSSSSSSSTGVVGWFVTAARRAFSFAPASTAATAAATSTSQNTAHAADIIRTWGGTNES